MTMTRDGRIFGVDLDLCIPAKDSGLMEFKLVFSLLEHCVVSPLRTRT
jgi:hypothetical protein